MKSTLTILFLFISILCFSQQKGKASYYANKFEGRKTASGEVYHANKKTAAHKTLPFGTMVKVTNLDNNKSVVVRINDRGPFVKGRIIDLSKSAAKQIDGIKAGIMHVKIEVLKDKKHKKKKSKKKSKHHKK